MTNNSKDTVNFEKFSGVKILKNNRLGIKQYTISEYTANVDFRLDKVPVRFTCVGKLDYCIDGERSTAYKFSPNEKLLYTILLNENDDTQIKFVSIQLNKSDKISFKR